jgi:hypothetical protein
MLVELQALIGRRHWRTFAVASTAASGRFAYTYRFTSTTSAQTYTIRAVVPRQRGYERKAMRSRSIRVHVT